MEDGSKYFNLCQALTNNKNCITCGANEFNYYSIIMSQHVTGLS